MKRTVARCAVISGLCVLALQSAASSLTPARLGVLYNIDEPTSREIAVEYSAARNIPRENVVGIHLPLLDKIPPEGFAALRDQALNRLPTRVQSLALLWSRPYAVGCMSVTTAFAAGYRPAFCDPGCRVTATNPLYDTDGWLPADTVGWLPAMLLPTSDEALARALIKRGKSADGTRPEATVYLVRTQDAARNVRSTTYGDTDTVIAGRARVIELETPVEKDAPQAIAYFTGVARVEELARIHFLPGAVADHLTSFGGVLNGGSQMSALAWLQQGATASFGTVSEPCNVLAKFPNPNVLLRHYYRGETALEAYWKSVGMPGQGLFIGEPLARPFGAAGVER